MPDNIAQNGTSGHVRFVPYSVVKNGVVIRNGLCPESKTSELRPEIPGERIVANATLPVGSEFKVQPAKPLGQVIKELQDSIAKLESKVAALEAKVK